MKYLILIYGNPESRAIWDQMPETQKAEGWRYYAGITCATRRHQPGGVKGPTFGLSQQPVEAESSPTLGGTGSGGKQL